jgi:hypothetical protein
MTEFFIKPPFRSSHYIDTNSNTLDLYRLLSYLYASRKFAELNTSLHDDPVNYLLQYESSEITRILLCTAVTFRIVDDRDERILDNFDTTCGCLIEISDNVDRRIGLSLREACNKIIHAKKVHFDTSEINLNHYLNPTIYLYGSHKGKEWKAVLDIERFVFQFIEFVAKFNQ